MEPERIKSQINQKFSKIADQIHKVKENIIKTEIR